MSFVNMDVLPSVGGLILPLIGRNQVIRKNTEDCLAAFHQHCKLTDDHLKKHKFLIGERITVADYFAVSLLTGVFKVFHKTVHRDYPNMSRWFYEAYNMPLWKEEAGELEYVDLDGVSELMDRGEKSAEALQAQTEAPKAQTEPQIEASPAQTEASPTQTEASQAQTETPQAQAEISHEQKLEIRPAATTAVQG